MEITIIIAVLGLMFCFFALLTIETVKLKIHMDDQVNKLKMDLLDHKKLTVPYFNYLDPNSFNRPPDLTPPSGTYYIVSDTAPRNCPYCGWPMGDDVICSHCGAPRR